MIQGAMGSIKEAEDRAKQMVAEAEGQATEIAQQALKSVKIIESEASTARKSYIANSNMNAGSRAHSEAQQLVAEGKSAVDEQLEKYSVNSYKAVAFVMEQIL